MATYKVLQDIEAEDKFLGPLTLKQCILAGITAIGLYLSGFFLSRGIWIIAVALFPFELVLGFLAFPWGRDQPTEIWLLAKLRYLFKPRRRIWDQSGIQELVKITVPKKVEEHLTDGLSNTEVKSRLKALADTIDSRGWVIKNVDVNMFTQPAYGALAAGTASDSDRLVDLSSVSHQAAPSGVTANDDIFSNPLSAKLDAQIAQSKQQHQTKAVHHMQHESKKASLPPDEQAKKDPSKDFWFMDQPQLAQQEGYTMFKGTQVKPGQSTDPNLLGETRKDDLLDSDSRALLDKVHRDKSHSHDTFRNHRHIDPFDPSKQASPTVTATPAPDILNAAIDNNRFVDGLAREARKNHPEQPDAPDDEVVVSLH